MATMIKRPCTQPGCPGIAVRGGRCMLHQRAAVQRYDAQRGTPAERGYDYEWRKMRSHVLAGEPCCVDPFSVHRLPVLATDVDHVVSLRRGGDNSIDNLQPLCHTCHSRKTATRDGGWGWGGQKSRT